ncbi:MAG: UpxY family transcription antiterminator [Gemmatimonadota bacterium]|nr:UpxY family transcription antiterminator [Gemmatimonadota bacterium]
MDEQGVRPVIRRGSHLADPAGRRTRATGARPAEHETDPHGWPGTRVPGTHGRGARPGAGPAGIRRAGWRRRPDDAPADGTNRRRQPLEEHGDRSWYALHTRSRHEKRVEGRLRERELESWLPLAPRESRWHDRTKVVEWPLFPGYVFVCTVAARLAEAAAVAGVAGVVRAGGRPAPIPEEEIATVREVVAILAADGTIPEAGPLLRTGEAVRVRRGPFRGVVGRVVERRGDRATIQIGLDAIGQGVRLDVAAADLEPRSHA